MRRRIERMRRTLNRPTPRATCGFCGGDESTHWHYNRAPGVPVETIKRNTAREREVRLIEGW